MKKMGGESGWHHAECADLLAAVDDDPRRRIALQLGLHGLRTDEIVEAGEVGRREF